MPISLCKECGTEIDRRSLRCTPCRLKYDHPRKGTGNPHGTINVLGYRMIQVDNKSTLEHRHVMLLSLGRELLPEEVVHHKNGDRADNRLENLELIANHSEHMKQHSTPERMKELSKLGLAARWGG